MTSTKEHSPGIIINRPLFTQKDVLELVKPLTEKKLQMWIHRGHIRLEARKMGSGHKRLWTGLEVIRLGAVVECVENGLPVGWATVLADRIVARAEDTAHVQDFHAKPGATEVFGKPAYFCLRDRIVAYIDGVSLADVERELRGCSVFTVIHPDILINEMVCRMEILASKDERLKHQQMKIRNRRR